MIRSKRLARILGYLALLTAIGFIVFPFLWLVITSLMTESEAQSVPPHWLPENPTLDNFRAFVDPERYGGRAVTSARAVRAGLRNSMIVALAVAAIVVVFGGMAGYAFARFHFRAANGLLLFYLLTRMVPPVALMIPTFLVMRRLELLDNLASLILVDAGVALPFTVWILRSYFKTIPRELEEAAMVDGCSWLAAVVHVVMPVAVPGLVAAGLFGFLTAWGDFVYPVVLSRTGVSQTIPVIVAQFASGELVEKAIMTAAGVVAVIPPLVLALVFQRFLVQGLVAGSTKG